MGKPAARISDMHVCPMVSGMVPHVGGPVSGPSVPTVLIGGMPAAVMGDMCVCVGPPDTIILGSMGVFIGGKPAARMGDSTVHGGKIIIGCPTVLIGDASPGSPPSPVVPLPIKLAISQMTSSASAKAAQIVTMKQAAANGTPFCEICAKMAAQAAAAVSAVGNAVDQTVDYLKHTSINIGGELEVNVGAQASLKGALLGEGAGATVNLSALKLFGLDGKLGASMAEGFKKEGEVSWVGKDKSFEVGQEIAGEILAGGAIEHSAKYKSWKKVEDTVKGSVSAGPIDLAREKKGDEITDSAEFEIAGFNIALGLGLKVSITASLEHDNET